MASSSSSKPTAVHFSLVFFVMATLILALVAYLTGKEYAAATAKARDESEKAATQQAALNNAVEEINTLKSLLGYDFEKVGVGEQPEEGTVAHALRTDLRDVARDHVQPSPQTPSVSLTLRALRTALDNADRQIQGLQAGTNDVEARLAQEKTAHQNRADQLQASQENSEAQLQELVAQRDELLSQKDREITQYRDSFHSEQREKEAIRDELNKVRNEKDEQIAELENRIEVIRRQLNELEDLSFDKPDGAIVRVDNTTRKVWIDLGSADNLRNQVGFSVYAQNNRGVGTTAGKEDIKAKIEVTKIVGPNLAEANIIAGTENLSRPILAGDPIYSPIWSKGAKEYFSFVGVVDMNGDGTSDRELLRNVLETAGGGIEIEVDDKGERHPPEGKLSQKSKFLVIGSMEDPYAFPGFSDKQKEIEKVAEEMKLLEREALRRGIRVVNFRDFLDYIGYEPQQRMFQPGESRKFNLTHGARTPSTDPNLGRGLPAFKSNSSRFNSNDRSSNGSTSGLYRN